MWCNASTPETGPSWAIYWHLSQTKLQKAKIRLRFCRKMNIKGYVIYIYIYKTYALERSINKSQTHPVIMVPLLPTFITNDIGHLLIWVWILHPTWKEKCSSGNYSDLAVRLLTAPTLNFICWCAINCLGKAMFLNTGFCVESSQLLQFLVCHVQDSHFSKFPCWYGSREQVLL